MISVAIFVAAPSVHGVGFMLGCLITKSNSILGMDAGLPDGGRVLERFGTGKSGVSGGGAGGASQCGELCHIGKSFDVHVVVEFRVTTAVGMGGKLFTLVMAFCGEGEHDREELGFLGVEGVGYGIVW